MFPIRPGSMLSFETISSKKLFCELTAAAGLLWGVIAVDDVVISSVPDKYYLSSILADLVIPGPTKNFLSAEPAVEFAVRNEVAGGNLRMSSSFGHLPLVVVMMMVMKMVMRVGHDRSGQPRLLLSSSHWLRLSYDYELKLWVIRELSWYEGGALLRIEMFEVGETVETLFDLAVESRKLCYPVSDRPWNLMVILSTERPRRLRRCFIKRPTHGTVLVSDAYLRKKQ